MSTWGALGIHRSRRESVRSQGDIQTGRPGHLYIRV
jgi:hypothetical protein